MIGYTMLGVMDIQKSAAFYDPLFALMGASRKMENEKFILWNDAADNPSFSICLPYDGKVATVGNGSMIAFNVNSISMVDKIYHCALTLGAMDEGSPSLHDDGYYMGYFRDPDGNKLGVYNYHTVIG